LQHDKCIKLSSYGMEGFELKDFSIMGSSRRIL